MNTPEKLPIINCVVVTYNRLSLLQENILALKQQTFPLHKIFIINNCSTDGTHEFLDSLSSDSQMGIIHLPENKGGAWGFYEGIKQAVLAGCDYVWIMDDDTIPTKNALEELTKGLSLSDRIGFVCSKVIWTDGSLHKMNGPNLVVDHTTQETILKSNMQTSGVVCESCSFVSVLFSSKAVREVGLPIKEFFIWADDLEYTSRIHLHRYDGFYIERSVVVHKTDVNYGPKIQTAPVETAWKFYYHARNMSYINRSRKKNILIYYISLLNRYRIYLHRINKRTDSKENKKKFKDAVKRGCKDAISFKPSIEYLP